VVLSFAGAAVPARAGAAGVLVTPSRVDARVRPGATLPPITVRNDTRAPIDVTAEVLPIRQEPSGMAAFVQSPAEVRATRALLAVASPRFRLAPGASRPVRVRVTGAPRSGIAAYAAVVFTLKRAETGSSGGPAVVPRLRLSSNLLLRFPGRARIDGRATAVRVEQGTGRTLDFIASVRNDGNIHARPRVSLAVLRADGTPVLRHEFTPENVLPGATRELVDSERQLLPAGEYRARIEARFGRRRSAAETTFRLTGPNQLPTPRLEIASLPAPEVKAGSPFDASVTVKSTGTDRAAGSGTIVLARAGGGPAIRRERFRLPPLQPGATTTRTVRLPGVPDGTYELRAELVLGGRTVAERAVEFSTREQRSLWSRVQDWLAGHIGLVIGAFALILVLTVGALLAYVRRLKARAGA
jgi:hypothetical protein